MGKSQLVSPDAGLSEAEGSTTDTDTDADIDADTDADSDSDTDSDADTDTDVDTDADSDSDSDSDSESESESDGLHLVETACYEEWPGSISISGASTDDVWNIETHWDESNILSHFDGNNWRCYESPAEDHQTNFIWSKAKNNVWMGSVPWHFDGQKWRNRSPGVQYSITEIWSDSPSSFYATAIDTANQNQGVIFYFNDDIWHQMTIPANTPALTQISGHSNIAFWAGGINGTLLKWDGAVWVSADIGISSNIVDIASVTPTSVYLISGLAEDDFSNNKLFYNDGGDWMDLSKPDNTETCDETIDCHESIDLDDCDGGDCSSVPPDCCFGIDLYTTLWAASPTELYIGTESRQNVLSEYSRLYRFDGSSWEFVWDFDWSVTDLWGIGDSIYVGTTQQGVVCLDDLIFDPIGI